MILFDELTIASLSELYYCYQYILDVSESPLQSDFSTTNCITEWVTKIGNPAQQPPLHSLASRDRTWETAEIDSTSTLTVNEQTNPRNSSTLTQQYIPLPFKSEQWKEINLHRLIIDRSMAKGKRRQRIDCLDIHKTEENKKTIRRSVAPGWW